MARKIDPQLVEIMKRHGGTRDDLWDCHGTWVVYHAALERMAAQAGVVFDMPDVVQPCAGEKTAVILVVGRLGDRSEWSFGEAAPANNKNAYPWAMAEKRAKDRVALKLLGLHGLHSEDEADEFKASKTTAPSPAQRPAPTAPPPEPTPFDDGPPAAPTTPPDGPISDVDSFDLDMLLTELGDEVRQQFLTTFNIKSHRDLPASKFASAWKKLQVTKEARRKKEPAPTTMSERLAADPAMYLQAG